MSTSSEKSTFSQTCNLLSRYIKEKGNSGNLTTLQKPCTAETKDSSDSSCHSGTTNVTPKSLSTRDFLTPMVNSRVKESKTAQLTMFYNGQVIVLDNFPAEKVEELKSFAQTQPLVTPMIPQLPCGTMVVDMPIARKASLLRFMEKRKNRVAAKSPYYKTSKPISDQVDSSESIPWLVLGAKPT